jgi:hypothetical protein
MQYISERIKFPCEESSYRYSEQPHKVLINPIGETEQDGESTDKSSSFRIS